MRIVLKLTAALFFGILTACVLDLALTMLLASEQAVEAAALQARALESGRLAFLTFVVATPLVGFTAHRLLEATRAAMMAACERREETTERLRQGERLSTVSRLASNLAHELGTPLNVVSGRAMMIAAGEVGGDEAIDSARVIVEQANRMTACIRQTLTQARKPRGPRTPAEVQVVLDEVLSVLERKARKSAVSLVVDDPREPIVVEMDRAKLAQLVADLVTNAIEAMPNGGIVHVGARHEPKITEEGIRPVRGRFVRIHVRDQGAGIAKEDQQAIFKPFFTTKGESDSAGLGLSIAQGIARDHGGWIYVESSLGAGSCFSVCLPEGGS